MRDSAVDGRAGGTAWRVRWDRVVLLLGALAVIAATVLAASASSSASPAAVTAVVVERGDTVWDMAARHASPGVDRIGYVRRVVELNGVDASALQPGTVLLLPSS